ncbi:MAG: Tim44/TimA family putative adaptor protein [Alphaproteobacteria bacterium]
MLDLIVFAMVAAGTVLWLRSVLGRRTGQERPPTDPYSRDSKAEQGEQTSDRVVALPNRKRPDGDDQTGNDQAADAEAGADPLQAGLRQISLADPEFDSEGFIGGVRGAFEMIVNAYAAGDVDSLRPLLSDEVYDNFASAIAERQTNKHQLETTLVGIRKATLIEASMDGRVAFVTAKLVSEQINVTRDKDSEVVDGDPGQIATVTDIWTFARNTRSRNPNWTLVATDAPN